MGQSTWGSQTSTKLRVDNFTVISALRKNTFFITKNAHQIRHNFSFRRFGWTISAISEL